MIAVKSFWLSGWSKKHLVIRVNISFGDMA
jgi:hypothetical protein